MKPRMITVVLFMNAFIVFAQETDLKKLFTDITTAIHASLLTRQSSIEISGSVSFDYHKTSFGDHESRTEHILRFDPTASYFIVNHLSLGLCISSEYQRIEWAPDSRSETYRQTFAGPAVKYYFGRNRFRPFLYTDYLLLAGDKDEGRELGLGGGIFYHVAGNFGFTLRIKYGKIWSQTDSQYRICTGLGISAFVL